MAKVIVLGAGVMGSAFAKLAVDAGHDVSLVGTHLDRNLIYGIRANRIHSKLKVALPEKVTPFTHDQLDQVFNENTHLIVLGVNSSGVTWAVEQIGPLLKAPIPILMLTKGLAIRKNSLRILPDIVREDLAIYGIKDVPVGAVGGPCIVGELAVRRDSSVVIAYPDRGLLNWILEFLKTPYYHIQPSTDLIGVEVSAALKNFYALAVGFIDGQLEIQEKAPNAAQMNNPAAGLFVQALAEMAYLVNRLGGHVDSVTGLAGIGDLFVTCRAGRNMRMGKLLGSGLCYSEAKTKYMPEDTVEGAELASTIRSTFDQMLDCKQIDRLAVPLAIAILDMICKDRPMQIPWKMFYRGMASMNGRIE